MKHFLQLDNNVVTGELFATGMPDKLPEGRKFIELKENETTPEMLSIYNETTKQFIPPQKEPDYGLTISPRTFLQLFTFTQRMNIRAAAKLDPVIEDFMSLVQVPEPIRLKHPTTLAGLNLLVSKNLLTQSEATRISNGTPPN